MGNGAQHREDPPKREKGLRQALRNALTGSTSMSLPALLEQGMIDEVEARIASTTDRLDALTWATMRSLLLGHRGPAAAGIQKLGELARTSEAREPWERYWIQRFWAAFEWGSDDERRSVVRFQRMAGTEFCSSPLRRAGLGGEGDSLQRRGDNEDAD